MRQRRHIRVWWHFTECGLVHDGALKYLSVKSHGFSTSAVEIQIRCNIHVYPLYVFVEKICPKSSINMRPVLLKRRMLIVQRVKQEQQLTVFSAEAKTKKDICQ